MKENELQWEKEETRTDSLERNQTRSYLAEDFI